MNRKLSLQEWHEMAQKGAFLPLRIQVNGDSMFPLVRRQRDYVTIQAYEETEKQPARGDIVLFSDPGRERYVLHRIWQVREDQALTWGDHCNRPDGWIPFSHIWGKTVLIERGDRRIVPDPAKGIPLARAWHILGKGYRAAYRVARGIKRRIRKSIGTSGTED